VSLEHLNIAQPRLPAPGEQIAGKYEVERVLGAGGMGIVVAARHLQLGQRVAIKFLRGEGARDPNAVERFLREARAAVTLASEHVTRVLDVGTLESNVPYIVMEYLAGADLSEVLRARGTLTIHEAVDFVLQASEAIAEAHANGIVHRDLKPSNLFVTQTMDGRPLIKVLDFGISKMAQTGDGPSILTASGNMMGSPGYMSPEQVRSAKTVDPRSDVWALGVILYELLSGTRPFRGDTFGEMFAQILSETPPSLSQITPAIPAGLGAAVARCLERDLRRRVPNVAELALLLQPFALSSSSRSIERILGASKPAAQSASTESRPARNVTLTGPNLIPTSPTETASSWQGSRNPGPAAWRPALAWTLFSVGTLAILASVGIHLWDGTRRVISPVAPMLNAAQPVAQATSPAPFAAQSRPADLGERTSTPVVDDGGSAAQVTPVPVSHVSASPPTLALTSLPRKNPPASASPGRRTTGQDPGPPIPQSHYDQF
jgi:eukaryotic-like serine/threonine-protein kinase